jgi:hypothetical protein
MSFSRSESGQASVELVALLPLVAVIALALWQGVVTGQAAWLAGSSARAAARASAVGGDPRAAAASLLPDALRRGLRVDLTSGGTARVRVRVPLVVAGGRLATVASTAHFAVQR